MYSALGQKRVQFGPRWGGAACAGHWSNTSVRKTDVLAFAVKRRVIRFSRVDGASHRGSGFSKPKRLYSSDSFINTYRQGKKEQSVTVYTVRIETSNDRRSALDDLQSGVLLCLFGKDGNALLHRVDQIKENTSSEEIVGPESGAACVNHPKTVKQDREAQISQPYKIVQRRFQTGSIDEVCFLGPDMGPIEGLLIGPENGEWKPKEVAISNSTGGGTQRFMCDEHLGQRNGSGAAMLLAIPEGMVLYGSGDQARLISTEEAEAIHNEGMDVYHSLKKRILSFTGGIIASGLVVAGATGGTEAAQAFALGGMMAVAYQLALNRSVDTLPLLPPLAEAGSQPYPTNGASGYPQGEENPAVKSVKGQNWQRQAVGGSVQRQALVAAFVLCALYLTHVWEGTQSSNEEVHELTIIITAMLGFASYKVAVVAASLSPSSVDVSQETPAKRS